MKYKTEANRMNYTDDILDRFWSKVIIPIDYINECWTWTACKEEFGYGCFTLYCRTKFRKQVSIKPHRFVYESYFGQIVNDLLVCHSCDNPSCVNPNHLFLGTYLDNTQDRISKGRPNNGPKGETHHFAVLTEDIVIDLLTKCSSGEFSNINQICRYYDVHRGTIDDILQGKTWKEISNNFDLIFIRSKVVTINLTNDEINIIQNMLKQGYSISKISKFLKRGETTIRRIKKEYNF